MIAAAANSRALWYLTRGTGLVSLVLLTASVLLGVLQVSRWSSPRWPRFVTQGLHKNISLLVTAFLGVHIATSVVDSFVTIRWVDAVVPFVGRYRPFWLGLGALAFDLLLALIVTSLLRERIGYRAWRAVHWAAYLCWPVALFHGIGIGTDTRIGLVFLLYVGCITAVVAAACWRLLSAGRALTPSAGRALNPMSGKTLASPSAGTLTSSSGSTLTKAPLAS